MSLDQEQLEQLRTSLRGPLLLPGDDGYDESRAVWNGMIDRYPALIARCVQLVFGINPWPHQLVGALCLTEGKIVERVYVVARCSQRNPWLLDDVELARAVVALERRRSGRLAGGREDLGRGVLGR